MEGEVVQKQGPVHMVVAILKAIVARVLQEEGEVLMMVAQPLYE